jgi:hypothetical protein
MIPAPGVALEVDLITGWAKALDAGVRDLPHGTQTRLVLQRMPPMMNPTTTMTTTTTSSRSGEATAGP